MGSGSRSNCTAQEHDVKSFLGLGVEAGDFFRPILQIAIHHHHPIAPTDVQSGGNAVVFAKIAAELPTAHPRVGRRQSFDHAPGIIAAAVFHQHDLEAGRNPFQRGPQPADRAAGPDSPRPCRQEPPRTDGGAPRAPPIERTDPAWLPRPLFPEKSDKWDAAIGHALEAVHDKLVGPRVGAAARHRPLEQLAEPGRQNPGPVVPDRHLDQVVAGRGGDRDSAAGLRELEGVAHQKLLRMMVCAACGSQRTSRAPEFTASVICLRRAADSRAVTAIWTMFATGCVSGFGPAPSERIRPHCSRLSRSSICASQVCSISLASAASLPPPGAVRPRGEELGQAVQLMGRTAQVVSDDAEDALLVAVGADKRLVRGAKPSAAKPRRRAARCSRTGGGRPGR